MLTEPALSEAAAFLVLLIFAAFLRFSLGGVAGAIGNVADALKKIAEEMRLARIEREKEAKTV